MKRHKIFQSVISPKADKNPRYETNHRAPHRTKNLPLPTDEDSNCAHSYGQGSTFAFAHCDELATLALDRVRFVAQS